MTDYSALLKADNDQPARSIHLVEAAGYDDWLAAQPDRVRAIVAAQKFQGKPGELAIVPGEAAGDWWVVAGIANKAAPGPWCLAKLAETLPEGMYRLAEGSPDAAALGWLTAHYRFDRYRKDENPVTPRVLLTSDVARIESTVQLAQAIALVRDLVNTPASDMGPADLEAEVGLQVRAPRGLSG